MKDYIVTIILAMLGSSSLTSLIIYFLTRNDNNKKCFIAVMGMMIRKSCKEAIKENSISYEELEQLQNMNSLYKELGGNGFVKTLMEKVTKLPITND